MFASSADTEAEPYKSLQLPPSLRLEQHRYKDIRLTTISAFSDLYRRGLSAPHRHIKWFMKVDEDTYIRIPELLAALKQAEDTAAVDSDDIHMFGYPWKDVDSKQWESPYCWGGPGYILSRGALAAFGPHAQRCYAAMQYIDGDPTTNQTRGQPSLTYDTSGAPRFGIEYEDMALARCLAFYLPSETYQGCTDIPGAGGTEFLSLWADDELWQWDLLRERKMDEELSVWTKNAEVPPRHWTFAKALTLHKVPPELSRF